MIEVEWDKKFELGHERIDFEHRVFLSLIRAVSDLSDKNDTDLARAGRTLMEVLKYAEFHFLSEENLMEDVHYPHIAEHRQEHHQLLTRLSELIHLSLHGEHNLRDIASFLFSWFSTHTTQVDQRLTAYIQAQGPAV